jgi:hypothetical protein
MPITSASKIIIATVYDIIANWLVARSFRLPHLGTSARFSVPAHLPLEKSPAQIQTEWFRDCFVGNSWNIRPYRLVDR